jgi:hypothetical protein
LSAARYSVSSATVAPAAFLFTDSTPFFAAASRLARCAWSHGVVGAGRPSQRRVAMMSSASSESNSRPHECGRPQRNCALMSAPSSRFGDLRQLSDPTRMLEPC